MLSMPRIVRPDPLRIRGRNLVPPLDWLLGRSIKRNKELVETSDWVDLQSNQA